jgi:hypothetical protein
MGMARLTIGQIAFRVAPVVIVVDAPCWCEHDVIGVDRYKE